GEPLDDADRAEWLLAVRRLIDEALAKGERSVITCSALRVRYREVLGTDRPGVALVYLKGDFATIARRLHERKGHFMPESLLASQFDALEEPGDALTVEVEGSAEDVARAVVDALARKSAASKFAPSS